MFKMITCNNGRTIYCGKVGSIGKDSFELYGEDYNSETKQNFKKTLNLTIDNDMMGKFKSLKTGDTIGVLMLPGRKDPNTGVAEVLVRKNEAISVTSEKGKEKLFFIGCITNKKWNDKKNMLRVNYEKIVDEDNNPIGTKIEYERYGLEFIDYYFSSASFVSEKSKIALGLDKLTKGDYVAMLCNVDEGEYKGKKVTNYCTHKWLAVK